MNPFILLFIAIIAEICATSALKLTDGFTRIYPSIIVGLGYTLSFWLLSLTLKQLPVGIVYAIWSGVGIIGIAIIGYIFFNESLTSWHYLGIAFILAGVLILQLTTTVH